MVDALKNHFTQKDYEFLYSFKSGEPDWSLASNDTLHHLPAVKWKLLNIQKMPEKKRLDSLAILEEIMTNWLEG